MNGKYYITTGPKVVKYLRAYQEFVPAISGAGSMPLRKIDRLSFSSVMFGGYDTATIEVPGDIVSVLTVETLLGNEVRIHDVFGFQVWEGFVNRIVVSDGAGRWSYGPVLDISNRIDLLYTEFSGAQMETGFRTPDTPEVDQSISEWGVLEEIVTSPATLADEGSELEGEAEEICDGLVKLKALPRREFSVDVRGDGQQQGSGITLECLGYFHLMKKVAADYFHSEQEAWPADITITWPLVANTPGFWRLRDVASLINQYTLVLYNEQIESAFEFMETCHSVLNAQGTSGNGFHFGAYNERSITLRENVKPASPDILVSARTGEIVTATGGPERRQVRPGMWAAAVHFPVLRPIGQEMFLIDSVEVVDGNMSLNAATFNAIDRVMIGRGI